MKEIIISKNSFSKSNKFSIINFNEKLPKKPFSVSFDYKITEIPAYLFSNTAIQTIHIPSSVEFINSCAFEYCPNLTEITLPDSVTTIEEYAFADSALEKITLSQSLKILDISAFENCNLKEILTPLSKEDFLDSVIGAEELLENFNDLIKFDIQKRNKYLEEER